MGRPSEMELCNTANAAQWLLHQQQIASVASEVQGSGIGASQQVQARGTDLEIHPALAQDLTGLGNTLQNNMILHAQLADQSLTLRAVPFILPFVAIHKQLVICSATLFRN